MCNFIFHHLLEQTDFCLKPVFFNKRMKVSDLLVFECEDDLDGAPVEAADARTEAHELVQIGHPLRPR